MLIDLCAQEAPGSGSKPFRKFATTLADEQTNSGTSNPLSYRVSSPDQGMFRRLPRKLPVRRALGSWCIVMWSGEPWLQVGDIGCAPACSVAGSDVGAGGRGRVSRSPTGSLPSLAACPGFFRIGPFQSLLLRVRP